VADFYRRRLAGVAGRWAGGGESGSHYLDETHPCAADLDLFGPGGLFERLFAAGTRAGADTLAAWLLAPAGPAEVKARQMAVADLRDRLDMREDLAQLAAAVSAAADFTPLTGWAAVPAELASAAVRAAIWLSGAFTAAALAACLFLAAGPLLVFAALGVQGLLLLTLRRKVGAVLDPVQERARGLAPLAVLLTRLERESFAAPLLTQTCAELVGDWSAASRSVTRLKRLLRCLPLADLLLARAQLALLLEAWRRASGPTLCRWLAAVGRVEALASLAAYSFEEPDDPFPEVEEVGPRFDAADLGHPLLPRAACVRNDVSLGQPLRLLVISGSNMSGKSTLLRTVGVNAVLALAGAPVRAHRLRLSPFVVGGTLRVEDSLSAGRSRFYAEVLRVRQLLGLAGGSPALLFLLDELFAGTSSDDRRVGAEAVLRRLLADGAVGLVTTHDLALTGVAERLAPRAANVHFADQFANGQMTFDYRLKPGVVQTSNGLALMRAVGIEV
jgi:hypothetical protein